MLLPADQRDLLAAFLRAHREALAPDAAGLAGGGRRRTPGLRREEVALLAGVSTTWYSWVEQGRDIALSPAAIGRLAGALRLSAAERAYLFTLTRRRDPAPSAPVADEAAPSELHAALRGMASPAYLLDRLWRARGWNDAAARLFSGWLGGDHACLLEYVFLDPTARAFIDDWPDRARRLVAEFRADTARDPADAAMQALLRGLLARSAEFARCWGDHAVLAREGGLRRFLHPADGALAYTQVTLIPAVHPDHKLVMLLPA